MIGTLLRNCGSSVGDAGCTLLDELLVRRRGRGRLPAGARANGSGGPDAPPACGGIRFIEGRLPDERLLIVNGSAGPVAGSRVDPARLAKGSNGPVLERPGGRSDPVEFLVNSCGRSGVMLFKELADTLVGSWDILGGVVLELLTGKDGAGGRRGKGSVVIDRPLPATSRVGKGGKADGSCRWGEISFDDPNGDIITLSDWMDRLHCFRIRLRKFLSSCVNPMDFVIAS